MDQQLHNYKFRVSKFLKDSTVDPVQDPDRVVHNIRKNNQYRSQMKGSRVMHFGAYRTDRERMDKA